MLFLDAHARKVALVRDMRRRDRMDILGVFDFFESGEKKLGMRKVGASRAALKDCHDALESLL